MEIITFYKAREGSMKQPEISIGANIALFQIPDGWEVWSISACDYVKNAMKMIEGLFKGDGHSQNSFKEPISNWL